MKILYPVVEKPENRLYRDDHGFHHLRAKEAEWITMLPILIKQSQEDWYCVEGTNVPFLWNNSVLDIYVSGEDDNAMPFPYGLNESRKKLNYLLEVQLCGSTE